MKTSFIATVFNEEENIVSFLKSVFSQSKKPDEIIIVDGGSTDATASVISNLKSQISNKQIRFKYIVKRGNRATGRNEAIKNAANEIIVCSDAGCLLDKDWVKNIIEPFNDPKVDVVAGYYKGKSKNIFQKCLIPYVLVMEDKLNFQEFLPASRSMAFKKSIWRKVGKFDEKYSHNEDYGFAHKLKSIGAQTIFAKKAIVNWLPRDNFLDSFKMFFRFAFGDSESGIIRNKVILVFARYFFGIYLLWLAFTERSLVLFLGIIIGIVIYFFWSIKKNFKYVNSKKAFFILPVLQLTSDLAVLFGTSFGLIKSLLKVNYKKIFKKNLVITILLIVYILTMVLVIKSGIPNQTHPFPYHMDEWHQLSAVRNVFRYGSPNLEGSANGTMFHFFISGVLLVPFYILGIINPFAIKSAIDSLAEQEKIFVVLRLTTLFFGVLTLAILPKIAKILKINPILITVIFLFTPAWLVLSNFFKYDIALTFWITLSFFYFLKYALSPTFKNFLFASFFSGIAFSIKVSALPLALIIPIAYFLLTPSFYKKYYYLFFGILIFLSSMVFLGLADIVFGGRNMNAYLYENIFDPSKIIENYNLDNTLLNFTLFRKLPVIFGHGLYAFSVLALFYVLFLACKDFVNKKYQEFKIKLFIILSFFVFCLSFIPLGITISANRILVLLPFITLINGIALNNLSIIFKKNNLLKAIGLFFLVVILTIQIFESYLWVVLKVAPSPQQLSSEWIIKNIPQGSSIGLENIPVYQFEPDVILKEFYNKQYNPSAKTKYDYSVINSNSNNLPKYIVISNVDYEEKYLKTSMKNDLVERMHKEGYERIAHFPLELPLYKNFYYPYVGLFTYPDGVSVFKEM